MNWGKGIILSFVLFAVFVIFLVVICFRQEVSLVSGDYYQKELQFQEQIDRMNNAALLTTQPVIEIRQRDLVIDFHESSELERGEILVFRPSDAALDRKFTIIPSRERKHVFALDGMHPGMYKVRMKWSVAGKGFYLEKTIQL